MIIEKHKQDALYATIINENPALALAEANGYIAKLRKSWVLSDIVAQKNQANQYCIGVGFTPIH